MARLGGSFLASEGVGALAALIIVAGQGNPLVSVLGVASFAVILLLLSLFDLWLPHGDSIDIAQPLAIGAVFVMGAVPAVGVACGARLIAHLVRYRFEKADQLLHLLARRVISLSAAGLVYSWARGLHLPGGTMPALILASSLTVFVDAVLLEAYRASRQRQSMGRLFAGGLRLHGLMWGAYASVAALTAVLYPNMGVWGLLLMMGLLVVMRQSLSLLMDIRGAYQATMSALAAAVEAHDPRRPGHAERVAALARAIGVEMGLHGKDLERLGYAGLLHDVDLIGTVEGEGEPLSARASEILADVGFLSGVVPVLALCDGAVGSDGADCLDRLLAYIVCRASNMDELITHEQTTLRVYSKDAMLDILPAEQREPVERAVWRLLAPDARLGA